MKQVSAPPIRGFLAAPFIAIASISAYIASIILPHPVIVADMNECVMLEEGETFEDLLDDEDE